MYPQLKPHSEFYNLSMLTISIPMNIAHDITRALMPIITLNGERIRKIFDSMAELSFLISLSFSDFRLSICSLRLSVANSFFSRRVGCVFVRDARS